jgi:quinol monooxygenase YgiN
VIEEYANKAAYDSHMAQPLVKEMIEWMSSGNVLAGEPQLYVLEYIEDKVFTKPEIVGLEDPHISFARIVFKSGKRVEALPFWLNVFEETVPESGSYLYGLLADKVMPDVLYTIQTYESEAYLRNVHLKENKAVKESWATLELSESVEHNVLKIVGGYLTK